MEYLCPVQQEETTGTHQANLLFHHYNRQIILLSPKSGERTMKIINNLGIIIDSITRNIYCGKNYQKQRWKNKRTVIII